MKRTLLGHPCIFLTAAWFGAMGNSVSAHERILGHNLTPTTNALTQNSVTVGTYALGYGITDDLTIMSSIWLDTSYNMPNIGVRHSFQSPVEGIDFAIEGLYFRTYPFGDRYFVQESYFLRFTTGIDTCEFWTSYLSYGFQYFLNDERAFSLRAVPQKDDPQTQSVSILNVLAINENVAILLEIGLLGINYPVSFQHSGASVNFGNETWMFQLGYSFSRSRKSIDFEVDDAGRTYWSGTSKGTTFHDRVVLSHPEIQIQYGF